MARLDSITGDYRWDKTEYVVTRDDGSCYKCFDDYDEAKAYYQYLQQLDNQEKLITQNQQIIDNQNAMLDHQMKSRQSTPQFIPTRPIHDSEYEEWLRYKKATDTKYQEWKLQEERKKKEIQRKQEEENRMRQEQFEKERIKKSIAQFRLELKQQTDSLNAYIKLVPVIRKIMSFGLDSVNSLNDAGYKTIECRGNSYKNDTINNRFLSYEGKTNDFYNQLKSLDKNIKELSDCVLKKELLAMKHQQSICQYTLDVFKRDFYDIRYGVVQVYEYLYIIKMNFICANDWSLFPLFSSLRRTCKNYPEKYHDLYVIMKQYGLELFNGCETIYCKRDNKSILQKLHDDNYDRSNDEDDRFFVYSNVVKPL